jgi:hypothetical protein
MNAEYARWIAANVEGRGDNKCGVYAARMASAFPELTHVWGTYDCPTDGEWSHNWCVTKDGEIVDPTAAQFASNGAGTYHVFKTCSDSFAKRILSLPIPKLPARKRMVTAETPVVLIEAADFEQRKATYRAAYRKIKAKSNQLKYALKEDWIRYVMCVPRICRIEALDEVKELLSDYWFWRLLGQCVWTSENHSVYRDLYLALMREPRPEHHAFMRPEQLRAWRRLPEKVHIFRGHGPLNRDGFWYSFSLAVAIEVAMSYGLKGRVSTALVSKHDLFFLGGDKESVIFVQGLGDIHENTQTEKR